MRDAVQLELLGIPTTTLVTTSFMRLAQATSAGLGMPDQAFAVVEHPLGGISAEHVQTKVRQAFAAVEHTLMHWRPTATDVARPTVAREIQFTGSVPELHAEFRARGWAVGLPFIPPTRELVDTLLTGTSHPADETVWDGVPPRMGILTVELVAACAAMAGCEPAHMPVLLAIVEALQDPAAWYAHQATTTGTESLMLLVNGPIATQLELASGTGAAGLCFPSNAALGYAIGLISKIVGGSKPPDRDKSTLSSPADLLNWALAENEAANPWQSYAVERGFGSSENVVTVKVVYPPIDINDHQSATGEELLNYIAHCINQPYVYAMRHQPVLLGLCPEHAATLAHDGFTKQAVRDYLWRNARFPASVYAKPAWDAGAIRPNEDFPDLRYGVDTLVPIVARPEDFQIIVCGGSGKHSHFWPGPKGMVSRRIDTTV